MSHHNPGALRWTLERKTGNQNKEKISWLYATLTTHAAFMLIIDFSLFANAANFIQSTPPWTPTEEPWLPLPPEPLENHLSRNCGCWAEREDDDNENLYRSFRLKATWASALFHRQSDVKPWDSSSLISVRQSYLPLAAHLTCYFYQKTKDGEGDQEGQEQFGAGQHPLEAGFR